MSVVISDFIYGPARKSDFSQLPNLIRTAIAPVSQQQLAVAVFGETSHFYGSYFPAVKTPVQKRTLNGEKVPYYVWVIGPPAQVARYAAEVFKNAPAQQAFFGLKTSTPAFAPAAHQAHRPQIEAQRRHRVRRKQRPDPERLRRPGGLFGGPESERIARRVAAAGIFGPTSAGAPAQRPGQPAAQLGAPAHRHEQSGQPVLAPYTHVLRLRVSKLLAPTATLTLALPAPETPDWVAAWSTTNDNTPAPRTFGLDQMLAGVRQSYPTPLPAVFTVQLPLKNDK